MEDVTLKDLVRSISGADDNGRSLNEILRIVRTAGRLDVVLFLEIIAELDRLADRQRDDLVAQLHYFRREFSHLTT